MYSNTSGFANAAFGFQALYSNTTGDYNIAFGGWTLSEITTQNSNTAVGYSAGDFYASSNSTFVGFQAYPNSNGYTNTTGIGKDARPTASNQMHFGNSSVTSIGGLADWTNISDGRFKQSVLMYKQVNIDLFPKAHFWLLIPFVLTVAGFYLSYWSRFDEAPWRQHMHGISATAWYILVVLQPWLIHHKPVSYQRKMGIVGIFLAGAVVFSAVQVIPHQVFNEFLPDVLKYGFSFADLCALTGFSTCVIVGVWHARNTNVHARWLISTVFWILLPATARLVYFPLLQIYEGNPPITYLQTVYICFVATTLLPLLFLMYLDYRKEKRVYISYVFTLAGVAFYTLAIAPMGKWQWWIDICHNVIGKGM